MRAVLHMGTQGSFVYGYIGLFCMRDSQVCCGELVARAHHHPRRPDGPWGQQSPPHTDENFSKVSSTVLLHWKRSNGIPFENASPRQPQPPPSSCAFSWGSVFPPPAHTLKASSKHSHTHTLSLSLSLFIKVQSFLLLLIHELNAASKTHTHLLSLSLSFFGFSLSSSDSRTQWVIESSPTQTRCLQFTNSTSHINITIPMSHLNITTQIRHELNEPSAKHELNEPSKYHEPNESSKHHHSNKTSRT